MSVLQKSILKIFIFLVLISFSKQYYDDLLVKTQNSLSIWRIDKSDKNWLKSSLVKTIYDYSTHPSPIIFSEIDPNDSNLMVTGSRDNTIKLWKLDELSEYKTIKNLDGKYSELTGLKYMKIHAKIIATDDNGKILAYDSTTGEVDKDSSRIGIFNFKSIKPIKILAVNQVKTFDEAAVVIDNDILAWDFDFNLPEFHGGWSSSGYYKKAKLKKENITSLSINFDGITFAAGSELGKIHLFYQGLGFVEFKKPLEGHTNSVACLSFVQEKEFSKILISGSKDKTVIFWNITSGEILKRLENPLIGEITTMAINHDGSLVVFGDNNSSLFMWNTKNDLLVHKSLSNGNILSIAIDSEGTKVVTSDNKKLTLWKITETDLVVSKSTDSHHGKVGGSMGLDRVNQLVYVPFNKGNLKIFDLRTGKNTGALKHGNEVITSVAVTKDGKFIATGSKDNSIKIWKKNESNIDSFQEVSTLLGHSEGITTLDFSPDGGLLASGSQDSSVRLWSVNSSQVLHVLTNHTEGENKGEILKVKFSYNGTHLASSSKNFKAFLWNVQTGIMVYNISHDKPRNSTDSKLERVNDFSFCSDEGLFVSVTNNEIEKDELITFRTIKKLDEDSNLYLWDLNRTNDTRPYLLGTNTETKIKIWTLAISPDCHYVAAGANNGYVILFELKEKKDLSRIGGISPSGGEVLEIAYLHSIILRLVLSSILLPVVTLFICSF